MSWYTANILIALKAEGRKQTKYPVYENVVLIEAASVEDAYRKAEKIGREEEAIDDALTLYSAPAKRIFAGIRKVITVQNPFPNHPTDDRPCDGTEITYSLLELDSEEAIAKLAKGEATPVVYAE